MRYLVTPPPPIQASDVIVSYLELLSVYQLKQNTSLVVAMVIKASCQNRLKIGNGHWTRFETFYKNILTADK